MKNTVSRVAVASRSFSRNPVLRAELLARYANVRFNDEGLSLAGPELAAFLDGHDKAIIALETISDEVLALVPGLKVISKYGVGLDMIDHEALARRGVRLGWTGGVNRRSVSELVIATAIGLLRNLFEANREVRRGQWRQHVGGYLSGKTVGIVGLGHIGKDLVGMLAPFRCRVLANDLLDLPSFCAGHDVEQVALDRLLSEADVVTLHVPLDASTRMMIGERELALMKPRAILINAARGGIVDESALKRQLISGALAGAAFDVFASEPPSDAELINLPNFFATPHIGGSAEEAILAMGRSAIAGLDESAQRDFGA